MKIKIILRSLELAGKPSVFCVLAIADSLLGVFFNGSYSLGDIAREVSPLPEPFLVSGLNSVLPLCRV